MLCELIVLRSSNGCCESRRVKTIYEIRASRSLAALCGGAKTLETFIHLADSKY